MQITLTAFQPKGQ